MLINKYNVLLRGKKLCCKFCSIWLNQHVSTSSQLEITFNSLPKKQKDVFKKNSVGLLNIPELTTPSGFKILTQDVKIEVKHLLNEILNQNRTRQVVQIFDEMSNTICKVADMAEFVRNCHPDAEMANAADNAYMDIARLVEELNTNHTIHEKLKETLKNGDIKNLSEIDKRVGWMFINDFELSMVSDKEKTLEFINLTEQSLRIGTEFSQNCSAPVTVLAKNIHPSIVNIFAKHDDCVVIANQYSYHPNVNVRETAYKIYFGSNESQLQRLNILLDLRYRLSKLTGFECFGQRILKNTMAQNINFVDKFLNLLSKNIKEKLESEMKIISNLHKRITNNSNVEPWNINFITNFIKQEKYNIDNNLLSSYFSLGMSIDGLNQLIEQIFGITMIPEDTKPGEIWHDDVQKLIVVDLKTNNQLGTIYCDLFDRTGKIPQDCHFTLCGGRELEDGSYQNPVIVIHMNFNKPSKFSTCLLTPNMLENLWHEFGHAIHSMLGRTKHQHTTGTRCPSDFAEIPSIVMELFINDTRVLKSFAKHYKTGETIPDDLIVNMQKSKNLFAALEINDQIFYSMVDQAYHRKFPLNGTTTDILKNIQNSMYHVPYIENTAWQSRFNHLVGYGARYYSYLLSKSVAACIWQENFENNPFCPIAGEKYREKILKHGGSKPPGELVSDMLGRSMNAELFVKSLTRLLKL